MCTTSMLCVLVWLYVYYVYALCVVCLPKLPVTLTGGFDGMLRLLILVGKSVLKSVKLTT